jgi:hypothetical protein
VIEQATCPARDAMRREIGWFLSVEDVDAYAINGAEALE